MMFPKRLKPKIPGLVLLYMGFQFLGCTPSITSQPIRGATTYTQKMDLWAGGFRRTYRIHVPRRYRSDTAWPLVVFLHGAFTTAKAAEHETGFSRLADQEGFIVLYPNGMGIFGFLQHWNAGHCCGKAAKDGVDDVGFVMAAIADVSQRLHIDPDRIYLAGHSNGGMLAFRMAAERTHRFAAAASVAGAVGGRPDPGANLWRIPIPRKPLPVMIIHGRRDIHVPYSGGPAHNKAGGRYYLSAAEAAQFWSTGNQCRHSPEERALFHGAVHRQTWQGCRKHATVTLLTLKNWAHDWPGSFFSRKFGRKDPLKGFDAALAIWQFFKGRSLAENP